MKRLEEEMNVVKEIYSRQQEETTPVNCEEPGRSFHTPILNDLSEAFATIGNNVRLVINDDQVRSINEKYKIQETCERVANDIATKTVDFVNSEEVFIFRFIQQFQGQLLSVEKSVKQWNERNHVTETIGNVFNTVATTTEQVVDRIFPGYFKVTPNPEEMTVNEENSVVEADNQTKTEQIE